jgi:hypothetical protein
MPDPAVGPPTDSLTIVIHLPQSLDAVSRLLSAIADIFPDAVFPDGGLARMEVPADVG